MSQRDSDVAFVRHWTVRHEHNTNTLQVVAACKPFEITWTPTTGASEKIIINLLKGPSTNAVFNSTIVSGIANSGSFSWTPGKLEATTDATGYGLQLVIASTGHFQYSTQFGINTDGCADEPSEPSSKPSGYPVQSTKDTPKPTPSGYPVSSSPVPAANGTTICSTTTQYVPPSGVPGTTGAPANSSIVLPTKSMSVPESLKTSATGGSVPPTGTGSTPPESTGAASSLKAGLGLAGAVAGLVFML